MTNQKLLDKNKPKELDRTTEISIGELNRNKLVDEITSKELSKPKELDWEKEFDKFGILLYQGWKTKMANRDIKEFIKQTLTQQRTELLEEILELIEKQPPIMRGKWVIHPDWIDKRKLASLIISKLKL